MHSYHHNIKTFNNATRHLTRVERSLYRDLIEMYYDSEKPIQADNFDRLARLVLANSDEEKEALRYVLGEFFVESGDIYTHGYCDDQIEKFYSNTTAKALAGKASAKARAEKNEQRKREREKYNSTPVEQALTDDEQNPTNKEPLTINQEPLKDNVPSGREAVPVQELVSLFNSSFDTLPEVKILNEKRRAAVRKRWLENKSMQTLERWGEFFEFVKQSDFLMGRTEKPWNGLCFDWIFNPSNFAKIVEGNYHEKNK